MLVEKHAGHKMYLYKSQYEAMVGHEAATTFDDLAVPWASEKPARIVLDATACLIMGVCAIDRKFMQNCNTEQIKTNKKIDEKLEALHDKGLYVIGLGLARIVGGNSVYACASVKVCAIVKV